MERTVRISTKGQITLPKQIRQILGSDFVRIVAKRGSVRIEPARDMGGSLRRSKRAGPASPLTWT